MRRCAAATSAASQAHPNNPTQALRGLRYNFGGCTTGAACPSPNGTSDPLIADALVGVEETFTVHVDNGDSYVGPTQVVAHVRVCP
ncbi:MAG: hypothetical protein NT062_06000 [Proteobacteria bacterium]|nr:hypothetical protein [Pseudomonadota bacterium]